MGGTTIGSALPYIDTYESQLLSLERRNMEWIIHRYSKNIRGTSRNEYIGLYAESETLKKSFWSEFHTTATYFWTLMEERETCFV